MDGTALALGDMPSGCSGRVTGTYEKSVTGLPYVIPCALMLYDGVEAVSIVRVILTSRDGPDAGWAQ
ncbi:hypothetical protein [Loktanella sp. M215]|uniref:hypothetical protein n=1 Tax=Loktanella sp. M215 TaxID=2675431 RepID=UPI001F28BB5A|nr:hypothetical protein [Loktanella sp. M215]